MKLDLPAEIGSCSTEFAGAPDGIVYLVASEVNHPPEAEEKVRRLLTHVHSTNRLGRVFVTLDASARSGEGEEPEPFDAGRYRFSNAKRTEAVVGFMVRSGMFSGGYGFAITSDPRCDAETCDDWYYWATAADALDLLNGAAGKISAAREVLSPDPRDVFGLVRLAWDAERWLAERITADDLPAMFPPHSEGGQAGPAAALSGWLALANRFYETNLARVELVCARAIGWLRAHLAGAVAVVLGLPWLSTAQRQLREAGVGHAVLIPPGLRSMPAIENVLAVLGQQAARTEEVMVPEAVRRFGVVRYSVDRPGYERWHRARRWAVAGARLSEEGRYAQAEECLARAIEIDPRQPPAWEFAGRLAYQRGKYADAQRLLRRAVALDPRASTAWTFLGLAHARLGRWRRGIQYLRHAVYLAPAEGNLWGVLGEEYHHQRRTRRGCHCVLRGAKLGEQECRRWADWHCGTRGTSSLSRPTPLWPPVIWAMGLWLRLPWVLRLATASVILLTVAVWTAAR